MLVGLEAVTTTPFPTPNRREWIRSLLCIAGVAPLAPLLSAHESNQGAGNWTPQFLSPEQNETLTALGERIIPGSTAAGCNRVIDLLMTVESPQVQQELLHALAAFDAEAERRYRAAFRRLQPDEQDAILTEASHEGSHLYTAFGVVKEWMADSYWTSRQGLQDLGWNGQVAWPAFPGCPHRSTAT